jgi:predicted metallo-beta-lactamase superfamily hydrolase
MPKRISVIPLAAESMGVRSMCTYVETSDVKLLLDAGVSLAPNRFGLPPHPEEYKAIQASRRRIAEAAAKAQVVTISHYHFDHHTPSFEDWLSNWTERGKTAQQIYQDKKLLVKDPRDKINFSQRHRAWFFERTGGKHAAELIAADGKTFAFGATAVKFSLPVFHGSEDSFLGWVLMTTVQFSDEKFMFAPDVQGPIADETLNLILSENPSLLMIGGPPSYLTKLVMDENRLKKSIENLTRIVAVVPITVVEHHLLRDENWRALMEQVFERAEESGHRVATAAELLGWNNLFLEASRRKLFAEHPPSEEFQRWMKMDDRAKGRAKPPV